jgi:sRNA-binding protein
MRNALRKSIRFKSIFRSHSRIHDFHAEDETDINHEKARLKTTRLRQALRSFASTRRFVNVSQRERNREFDTRTAEKHYNNHRFDCSFDQNIAQNSVVLKSEVCRRRTNDQTQATRMNRDAHKESMKRLSTRFEYQEENHREEKKAEIQKNFRNFYRSIDVSLTTRSMSAHQKSSAQENLKDVKFNTAKCN